LTRLKLGVLHAFVCEWLASGHPLLGLGHLANLVSRTEADHFSQTDNINKYNYASNIGSETCHHP